MNYSKMSCNGSISGSTSIIPSENSMFEVTEPTMNGNLNPVSSTLVKEESSISLRDANVNSHPNSPLEQTDRSTCNSTRHLIRTTKVSVLHQGSEIDSQSTSNNAINVETRIKFENSEDQILHSPSNPALSDKTNTTINAIPKDNKSANTHLYQGFINDSPANDKTRRKLRRIKHKDLENIIIEQFCTQLFYENELGYQRDLCHRLETTLEAANKRALKLSLEVEDFKNITTKLEKEHNLRKDSFILPSQIKRSVGIQCHLPNSSPFNSNKKSQKNFPNKRKRKELWTFENCDPYSTDDFQKNSSVNSINENHSNKDLNPLKKRKLDDTQDLELVNGSFFTKPAQKKRKLKNTNLSQDDLTTNIEFDSEPIATNSILKNSPHMNNFKKAKKLQVKFKENAASGTSRRSQKIASSEARPQQPVLKAKRKNSSIVLSWNMEKPYNPRLLSAFQLFACETSAIKSKDRTWHCIGEVESMDLPMMCTLADFKSKCHYHFSIRGISNTSKRGPFSKPCTIYMP